MNSPENGWAAPGDFGEITARLNGVLQGRLPGTLGMRFEAKEEGSVVGWFDVMPQHMGPNGYLHAASIIALIDTAAGYGCFIAKPAAATGFTTIELKANFLSTKTKGRVQGTASMAHSGSRTQVWDAVATCDGKTLALFRCTQMLLYPTGSAR